MPRITISLFSTLSILVRQPTDSVYIYVYMYTYIYVYMYTCLCQSYQGAPGSVLPSGEGGPVVSIYFRLQNIIVEVEQSNTTTTCTIHLPIDRSFALSARSSIFKHTFRTYVHLLVSLEVRQTARGTVSRYRRLALSTVATLGQGSTSTSDDTLAPYHYQLLLLIRSLALYVRCLHVQSITQTIPHQGSYLQSTPRHNTASPPSNGEDRCKQPITLLYPLTHHS